MFREGFLDKILRFIAKLIPKPVFSFFQPYYHAALSYLGAAIYGFPSRSLKVIGVTGTKGKSTTVFLIAKILEVSGLRVAAIGSLGFKISGKEWPNTLKMTMPGRMKMQKFLYDAKKAGCTHVVMEVTSEGIKQKRHLGINFDCAVFTNLHPEHIESHGSFEAYKSAKQELFRRTRNIHVINADDKYVADFGDFPANKKIYYGLRAGDMIAHYLRATEDGMQFDLYGNIFRTHLAGEFNVYNCLAALATSAMYGIDLPTAKPVIESIKEIPGRMQYLQREPFAVVVDYAHTPDSLRSVYHTLRIKSQLPIPLQARDKFTNYQLPKKRQNRLICVLGAAGGGRDKWKRPEFGKIAAEYCDEIILTNEDPYDENPTQILSEIKLGIKNKELGIKVIFDRREAIEMALTDAREGDTVVITGKGSETSMALAGGKKIPWSDVQVVREFLKK